MKDMGMAVSGTVLYMYVHRKKSGISYIIGV